MELKNAEVEPFITFLMSFELTGQKSRMRTRFVKVLMERHKLIQEEHADLIREFAKLDSNGEPVIIESNGQQMYDVPDREGFQGEYFLLLNENFIIEQNTERKEMLLFIKELILECDKTFKGSEALEYDRWCDFAEMITYE